MITVKFLKSLFGILYIICDFLSISELLYIKKYYTLIKSKSFYFTLIIVDEVLINT